jgi:RNA polymerase sigma factor (sigma-70 family)
MNQGTSSSSGGHAARSGFGRSLEGQAVSGPVLRTPLREIRARRLVDLELRRLEGPVLRSVRRRLAGENVFLPEPDLQDAYNQAWHGVYQATTRGAKVESLKGLLVSITWKRAIDSYRQRKEAMHTEAVLEEHPVELDIAERIDDRQKLERLVRRLAERLNARERRGVTLCLLQGYTRPEAAGRLGMSQPAFQKVMDSATRKLARVVAGINARGCGGDEWARLLRTFAFGTLEEANRDYERVVRHLQECDACERYVTALRALGAFLPPIVPFGPMAGGLVGFLRRSLSPAGHGARAASRVGRPAGVSGVGGVSTSAGTGGSGLVGLLGGGIAKSIAVLAASLAVAGVAVKGLEHHSVSNAQASSPSSSTRLAGEPVQSGRRPRPEAQRPKRRRHRHHAKRWHHLAAVRVATTANVSEVRSVERPPVTAASAPTSSEASGSSSQEEPSSEFTFESSTRSK